MIRGVILVEFIFLLLFVLGFNLRRVLRARQPLGEWPISPPLFVLGKLSMGASWTLLALYAVEIDLGWLETPLALGWVAAALFLLGLVLMVLAFLMLRGQSRFGVSQQPDGMRTSGVYGISRNPMYLGFYLITLASLLAVLHPANVCAGLLGTFLHHRVVLAEERFLRNKHGASYETYKREVRRYI